jgi:hypothetical protein
MTSDGDVRPGEFLVHDAPQGTGFLFQRFDARRFQTITHRLIDVCAVTPFVRRQRHNRIMDRGIN